MRTGIVGDAGGVREIQRVEGAQEAEPAAPYLVSKHRPSTSQSIPLREKVAKASAGVETIGSPL